MELWQAFARFYLQDAVLSTKNNVHTSLRNEIAKDQENLIYELSDVLSRYLVMAVKGEARHVRSYRVETYGLVDKWGLTGYPVGTPKLICAICGKEWTDIVCKCTAVCNICGQLWDECDGSCAYICSACGNRWTLCFGECGGLCLKCWRVIKKCKCNNSDHIVPEKKLCSSQRIKIYNTYSKFLGCKFPRSSVQDIEVDDEIAMLEDLVTVFSTEGWPSAYGGKSWAKITKCVLDYKSGELERTVGENYRSVFIDQVADLRHNGGKMFDKRSDVLYWSHESATARALLDLKHDSRNVYFLARQLLRQGKYYGIIDREEVDSLCYSILKSAPASNLDLVIINFNSKYMSERLVIQFELTL